MTQKSRMRLVVAGPHQEDLAPTLADPPPADHPALHWNRPEQLAPVGCWLLVLMPDGSVTHARRTEHIERKNRDQKYQLRNGNTYIGKLRWTPA